MPAVMSFISTLCREEAASSLMSVWTVPAHFSVHCCSGEFFICENKKENEKDRKFLKRVKVDAFLENSYNKKHRILHLKGGIGMKCSQLLEHLEYTCLQGSTDVKVTAVVNDSRKIEEGCLFLCIKGAAFDGHKFAAEAAEKGAAVLVVED